MFRKGRDYGQDIEQNQKSAVQIFNTKHAKGKSVKTYKKISTLTRREIFVRERIDTRAGKNPIYRFFFVYTVDRNAIIQHSKEKEKMNRSASLASIESFTSAIDSIEHVELIPIDSSTDAILDEKHDSMIKPESDGKKSNVLKDHKCCLLIATIVFIVFLCIFFIIIYSNRSEVYILDYNTDNLFMGFEFNCTMCTVIAIVIFICFK